MLYWTYLRNEAKSSKRRKGVFIMSQKKRNDRKMKWLRLAVGAALLTGGSSVALPEMVSAADITVADGEYYGKLWGTGTDDTSDPLNGYKFPGEGTSGNTVTFSGFASLGYPSHASGGGSATENVTGNTITIGNSTFEGDIIGGFSWGNTPVEISGNTVIIGEGTQPAGSGLSVYGGYSYDENDMIKDNTVNILTAIQLANLKGGNITGSGNTLNIAATDVKADSFGNFNTINFLLPSGSAGKTMLTVNNDAVDLQGVDVGIGLQTGASFNNGESVNLISATNGLSNAPTGTKTTITSSTAASLITDKQYNFTLSTNDNTLVAAYAGEAEVPANGEGGSSSEGNSSSTEASSSTETISSSESGSASVSISGAEDTAISAETIKNSQRLKSLVETQAAVVTVLNSGADMLTSAGVTQATASATAADSRGQFAPFAAMGGSNLRAKSGSHVDTKGYGIDIGFAREIKKGQNTYLIAPVVEYGRGSYDSYQDNGIKADGKSSFWGVGVLGRQTNAKGVYYEASLRAGRTKSDYKGYLVDRQAEYDSESNYLAGHLGWGMIKKVNAKNTLDTYVKFFYTQQDGDKVKVKINGGAASDEISFATVEIKRLRIGARLTHKVNDSSHLYGGLAYQGELDGKARATYRGSETAAPVATKARLGRHLELNVASVLGSGDAQREGRIRVGVAAVVGQLVGGVAVVPAVDGSSEVVSLLDVQ